MSAFILSENPIERELQRFFGRLPEDDSPVGVARRVAKGVLLNYNGVFLPKITENSALYKESHPAFYNAPRVALETFMRATDSALAQLKSESEGPRDALAKEISVVHAVAKEDTSAATLWQLDWLRRLESKGTGNTACMERQAYWVKCIRGGSEVAYSALRLAPEEYLDDLVGEKAELRELPFKEALIAMWEETKASPEKREQLATLNRAIETTQQVIAEKRREAQRLAGVPLSPERQFIRS